MTYHLKYVSNSGRVVEFGLQHGIVITGNTDLTSVHTEIYLSQGFRQVGGVFQGDSVQARVITINGEVMGAVHEHRRALLDAIVPQIGGKLVYRALGRSEEWEMVVFAEKSPAISNHLANAKFQFIVKAPHPYWRSAGGSSEGLAGSFAQFYFPHDFGTPIIFEQEMERRSVDVYNTGNVPIRFRATFKAMSPFSNPTITNVVTREFVRINRNFQTGETVVLDMRVTPPSVISTVGGIETSIPGALDINSTLFSLMPGSNTVQADADTNRSGMICIIDYHIEHTAPH